MPFLLAHGALGWWDEIIFAGVVFFFLVMMGLQWVKSRADGETTAEDTPSATDVPTAETKTDHFRLD